MAISDYTDPDEVRGILAVTDDELEDGMVLTHANEVRLTLALEEIGVTLPSLYSTVKALQPSNRSLQQQRLLDLTQVFSAYCISKMLAETLPMFVLARKSDGRAEGERFPDPTERVISNVIGTYNDIRNRLIDVYIALGNAATVSTARPFVGSAGINKDPVVSA